MTRLGVTMMIKFDRVGIAGEGRGYAPPPPRLRHHYAIVRFFFHNASEIFFAPHCTWKEGAMGGGGSIRIGERVSSRDGAFLREWRGGGGGG